jgi:hypothetical protein
MRNPQSPRFLHVGVFLGVVVEERHALEPSPIPAYLTHDGVVITITSAARARPAR